ncbi:MAG TPA: GNAT family N-acetyltransferase, partial [Sphingomonas sp.]
GNAIDAHFPKGAFWYLHIAGCDPAHQGRGLGGAAIRAGFDARVPTYLETPVEGYVPLYQRLGFTLTGDWRVPGGGPRFWSMWRDADASTGAPQPR